MAVVTVVYLSKRKEISITEPQRIARWLERLGEEAKPCPARGCRRPQDHSGFHYYTDDDALPVGARKPKRTYTLGVGKHGQHFIRCHICASISYHPEDIRQKYCGTCHQFHEILLQMQEVGYH